MDLHSEPLWQWPSESPTTTPDPEPSLEDSEHPNHAPNEEPEAPRKHYPPRMCRICLETVLPTVVPPSENLPDFLQAKLRVVYESSDPELGRLLRPCKCKGSSRYVHEGCLQAWRHADPGYGKRNYWQCPTCGFQYRLDRLKWAHWIGSTLAQLALTVVILICTVFLLGFVADPILNYYLDPVGAIYSDILEPDPVLPADETSSWVEHFAKGLASLGVLSFIKAMFALSPWNFFNTRSSVVFGNGRTTGRNRVASISWMVILVGVVTFLWTVFKGVRSWSGRTLQHAGERVMDVPLPDDEDEDDATSSTEDPQQRKKDD